MDKLAKSLIKFGAERGPDVPHLFPTPGRPEEQVVVIAHIDDFNCCGNRKDLEKLSKFLTDEGFELKFVKIVGDSDEWETYDYLGRQKKVKKGKTWTRPKQQHSDKLSKRFKFGDKVNPPRTPLATNDRGEKDEESSKLEGDERVMYRSGVGILIHVALDRGDLSCATRVCAKRRNDATKKDLERLKRVCKYAVGTRWLWSRVHPDHKDHIEVLYVDTDSDWAGNQEYRKSTSCAVIHCHGVVLEIIVRGQ